MSPYWAAVAVILVPLGTVLKYLVWDFFHKVQSLDAQYSTRIAEAHAAIHDRKFLPIIASIHDAIAARKAVLPVASTSTIEILTELSIDVKVREAITVVSERVALNGAYRMACELSKWVAIPWLFAVGFFALLFFWRYDAQVGVKSLWFPILMIPTGVLGALGCCTLTLYRLALNKFIRLLETNPL